MEARPLIIERAYHVNRSRLWEALISEHEMKNWFFNIPDFRAEVGYEFRFYGGPDENRKYLHICRIIQIIPEEKISYSWRFDGYEGESLVTFELKEDGGDMILIMTHEGLENFPASNPDFARSNFEDGWGRILHHSLSEYLEKSVVISMGG